MSAKDLVHGDALRDAAGQAISVTAVSSERTVVDTYNLEVDGVHTFFALAGGTSILVHNANPPPTGPTETTFVGQVRGPLIGYPGGGPIPAGSLQGPTWSGKGIIYYAPDGVQIRIMPPTKPSAPYQYPNGYVRVSGPGGQALNPATGQPVPTNSAAAHFPLSCP